MRFAAADRQSSGNWIKAGRTAADNAAKIFQGVTENSTDFGEMANAWRDARQSKELSAVKAQTDLVNTGLQNVTSLTKSQIEIDAADQVHAMETKQEMAGKLAAFMPEWAKSFQKDPEPSKPALTDTTALDEARGDANEEAGLNRDGTPRTNPGTDSESTPTLDSNNDQTDTTTDTSNGSDTETAILPTTGDSSSALKSVTFDDVYTLAKNTNVQFPELVAAQWQLETGGTSGQGPTANNNLFAQKGTDFSADTKEYVNGELVDAPSQGWQSYDSPQEAANWLVENWYNDSDRHGQGAVSLGGGTREGTAQALVDLGYATDPEYAQKLLRIVRERGY